MSPATASDLSTSPSSPPSGRGWRFIWQVRVYLGGGTVNIGGRIWRDSGQSQDKTTCTRQITASKKLPTQQVARLLPLHYARLSSLFNSECQAYPFRRAILESHLKPLRLLCSGPHGPGPSGSYIRSRLPGAGVCTRLSWNRSGTSLNHTSGLPRATQLRGAANLRGWRACHNS